MKLLIINAHPNAATQWADPLRKEGWGVICVRTTHEADKVLQFHGKSLDAVVLHREQAGTAPEQAMVWFNQFKKRTDYNFVPTMIMSSAWTERDILKHQNSEHSANAYFTDSMLVSDFKRKIETLIAPPAKMAVGQSTQPASPPAPPSAKQSFAETSADATRVFSRTKAGIALEEVSGFLSKPEITSSFNTKKDAVTLSAPAIFLGGKTSSNLNPLKESTPEKPAEKLAAKPVEAPEPKTTILEPEPEVVAMDDSSGFSMPDITLNPSQEIIQPTPAIEFSAPYTPSPAFTPTPAPVPSFQALPGSGGAPSDVDTLKSYVSMREHDVAVLTGQVSSAQDRIGQLEVMLKIERARCVELQHTVQKQEQVIKNYNRDKQVELDTLYKQSEDFNLQLSEKSDKIRMIESKLKVATEEVDKIKERVRVDIRRIRVREKELESQLEILKKDSSALLIARDEKIIELKRKIDLLEFNMELVQEQYGKERNSAEQLRQRLKDASSAMKQAGGLLDQEN